MERHKLWSDLDFIGVTAYFPLDVGDGASLSELVSAWEPYASVMSPLAEHFHRDIVFLEARNREERFEIRVLA